MILWSIFSLYIVFMLVGLLVCCGLALWFHVVSTVFISNQIFQTGMHGLKILDYPEQHVIDLGSFQPMVQVYPIHLQENWDPLTQVLHWNVTYMCVLLFWQDLCGGSEVVPIDILSLPLPLPLSDNTKVHCPLCIFLDVPPSVRVSYYVYSL